MRIPRDTRRLIAEHLEARLKDGSCVKCGETSFSLEQSLFSLQPLEPRSDEAEQDLPLIAVCCKNCGFVELYRALTMPFFAPKGPDEA